MDVFTRMIRGNRQVSQQLTQSLTLKPLQDALHQSVPEIHHSDQGAQYLSNAYITTLQEHGVEISVAHRGRFPWENGYAQRLIRTLKEEEKFISTTLKASPRREIASDILLHTSIISNAPMRR